MELKSVFGQSIGRLIARRGLENDVVITGSKQEVYPFHALANIYVQPSRDDAFPLATCEAMVLSKPVVAFPQGVALEDYASEAIVRVDEYCPRKLADAIEDLIKDPRQREARGKACRRVVEEHLDIRDTMPRYEALLLSNLSIAD
jgi:glycosyltransferase involved in cell wall biosynthesis